MNARDVVRRLNAEDREEISRVLGRMPIADHARKLGSLLGAWREFVRDVEVGYDDNIFEYLNDVSTRHILEAVLRAVPSSTRDHLAALLQPFDERFIAATVPIDRHLGTGVVNLENPPLLRDRPDLAGEWFYTRIPRNLSDELAADLQQYAHDN